MRHLQRRRLALPRSPLTAPARPGSFQSPLESRTRRQRGLGTTRGQSTFQILDYAPMRRREKSLRDETPGQESADDSLGVPGLAIRLRYEFTPESRSRWTSTALRCRRNANSTAPPYAPPGPRGRSVHRGHAHLMLPPRHGRDVGLHGSATIPFGDLGGAPDWSYGFVDPLGMVVSSSAPPRPRRQAIFM